MYTYDLVYRSLVYHMRTAMPPEVTVVDGESHGVRLDDPTGKPPSVTVTIDGMSSADIELGSIAAAYGLIYTVDAQSRTQRDAIKSLLFTTLTQQSVPVYTAFQEFTPASGAVIQWYGQFTGPVLIKDMPNFSEGRERFFWTALAFTDLTIIGV
jgi:hypothetical protein